MVVHAFDLSRTQGTGQVDPCEFKASWTTRTYRIIRATQKDLVSERKSNPKAYTLCADWALADGLAL